METGAVVCDGFCTLGVLLGQLSNRFYTSKSFDMLGRQDPDAKRIIRMTMVSLKRMVMDVFHKGTTSLRLPLEW